MPSRILYLGAPSRVELLPESSVVDALQGSGGNTGNLLIGDAIKRHLRAELFLAPWELPPPDQVARDFDQVVLGASNFLYRDFDFSHWADFLEATKLPCTMFGLGAQGPSYGCRVEVPVGTRRLLKLVSERSTTLGVRGHWTASILSDLGISNIRVIGCPAMYWTCKPALALKPRTTNHPLAVALNGAANCVPHAGTPDAAQRIETQLVQLSFQHGFPYFLQSELELAAIAANLPDACGKHRIQALLDQYGLSSISPKAFIRFVKRNTRIHFKVSEWHAALRQFDFVVGSRFHGSLMAVLAGVPCFVYAQDARTRELCDLLHLPHTMADMAPPVNIEALYCALELKPLECAYRDLYANYICFLEENGFEHNLTHPSFELRNGEAAHSQAAPLEPLPSAGSLAPAASTAARSQPHF
jgi:hypothetical protein